METINYIDELKSEGWKGFKSIATLKDSVSSVPKVMGVYMVLRLSDEAPNFIKPGTGGFFKGEDPNVPISDLKQKWNDRSPIMYIGKAGGSGQSSTLNSRLSQYMKFGSGKNIGHRGGRFIWQLSDADRLIVCWLPTTLEPEGVEFNLLKEYSLHHGGKLPFANISRGSDHQSTYEIMPGLLKVLSL